MKRKFIVSIEIPEDPDYIVTENFIEDALTSAYHDYEGTKYDSVYVWAEEEFVVSLEYLKSQDNTTPAHIQDIIDARVLQDGIMTPEELRKRMQ